MEVGFESRSNKNYTWATLTFELVSVDE